MKHGRAAQFRRARQAIPFQFDKPPRVRIHLLAGSRQPLDRQLLQALTQPIQSRRCAGIFKRKNQIDPMLISCGSSRARRGGGWLRGNRSGSKNDDDGQ